MGDVSRLKEMLLAIREVNFPAVTILGPRPNVSEKRANVFTWNLMLKSTDVNQLHNLVTTVHRNFKLSPSVRIKYDVDPMTVQ